MNRPYEFSDELKSYLIKQYTEFNISVNKLAIEVGISKGVIVKMLRNSGVVVSSKPDDLRKKFGRVIKVETFNPNKYYVYFHKTVDEDRIFYVGKGCGNRAVSRSNRSKSWTSFTENNKYYVEYFTINMSESDALKVESEQILKLPELLNSFNSSRRSLKKEDYSEYFKYSESSPSKLERVKIVETSGNCNGVLGDVGYTRLNKSGSLSWVIKFKNKSIPIHRLIWALFNEETPENMVVDHIDGDAMNNRIENLRCVTQGVNCLNKKKLKSNTSGTTGVYLVKKRGQISYQAAVMCEGGCRKTTKSFSLSKYGDTALNLATEWRKARIVELNEQGAGYTDRHGT